MSLDKRKEAKVDKELGRQYEYNDKTVSLKPMKIRC